VAEHHQVGGTGLRLEGVRKRFGGQVAVAGVTLEVRPGETLVLLGPSGCGKTTLLRIVAGLERPDAGQVLFGERDVTGVPVRQRGVGMVFQSYALFPHLTVADNVAYGLRARGVAEADVTRRVADALALVDLVGRERHYPAQLSGGQQQRVAIARALVVRPALLLLDEPFGALDLKLRRRMQLELRGVLRRAGATALHVTHDQEEALALADRVAVMRDGRVEQIGAGEEVYARPRTAFVASFLGEANLLPVETGSGAVRVVLGDARVPMRTTGSGTLACLRPEHLRLSDEAGGAQPRGTVRSAVFLGEATVYEVALGGVTLKARVPAGAGDPLVVGREVGILLPEQLPLVEA